MQWTRTKNARIFRAIFWLGLFILIINLLQKSRERKWERERDEWMGARSKCLTTTATAAVFFCYKCFWLNYTEKNRDPQLVRSSSIIITTGRSVFTFHFFLNWIEFELTDWSGFLEVVAPLRRRVVGLGFRPGFIVVARLFVVCGMQRGAAS